MQVQWRSDFRIGEYPRHSFRLRRARLKFRYVPSDIGASVELGCDELNLRLRDAFIRYRFRPWLRFVLGLQKMPFSLEELTPANRLLVIERSRINDRFGELGYLGRDIGMIVEGELASWSRLGYALGLFNGAGWRLARDNNNAKQLCGRLTGSPASWLVIGVDMSQRHDSLTGKPIFAWGGDAAVQAGSMVLQAEILTGRERAGQMLTGGYLAGALRLAAFEPVLRLTWLGQENGSTCELTAGGNWYIYRRLQLKANIAADMAGRRSIEPLLILQTQADF